MPESPPEFDLASEFAADLDNAPADERVYRVALGLYEPARVSEVAARADCAPDTARRHLERLADMGVLDRVAGEPALYRRNESYFEWRKRERLAELTPDQRRERLAELTARLETFEERYGADHPSDVDALEHADYDGVEDVWLDLDEWGTVRRRIRRLETVRRARTEDASSEAA